MTVWISQQHNEDRLTGTLTQLTRGSLAPRIKFYNGTRPAGGGTPTTLLATVVLNDPPGTVSGNKLVLSAPPDALVGADGTATWARVENGEGNGAIDCDVTDNAGSGEIKLESVALLAGGGIRIISAEFG